MPEQVYGWTLKELGLFLEGVARRRRERLEEAVTAGWVAELCARQDRMDPLPVLFQKLLPGKPEPEDTEERKESGMTPAQQAVYLRTLFLLSGAKVIKRAPAGDPGRN